MVPKNPVPACAVRGAESNAPSRPKTGKIAPNFFNPFLSGPEYEEFSFLETCLTNLVVRLGYFRLVQPSSAPKGQHQNAKDRR